MTKEDKRKRCTAKCCNGKMCKRPALVNRLCNIHWHIYVKKVYRLANKKENVKHEL